ncbi:MAG: hypothetical protein IJT34_05685 [Butyrivibrio sp.]|nr:hypothetical protein [Butyrivibrio sp.]
MQKRIVLALLTVAMLAVLPGCGKSGDAKDAGNGLWQPKEEANVVVPAQEQKQEEAAAKDTAEAGDKADAKEEAKEETKEEAAAPAASSDAFIGNWYEEIAGRGYMTITAAGDSAHIQVNWSGSASEMSCWQISAQVDAATGDLVYDNGTYQTITFDEDGNDTVTEERPVQGRLTLAEDGQKLSWVDNAFEEDPDPSVFIKE